jgi:hypothetical protein
MRIDIPAGLVGSLWRCGPSFACVLLALSLTSASAHSRTRCSVSVNVSASPALMAGANSAADFRIWRTIKLGEYRDVRSIRAAFDTSHCPLVMSESVDEAIGRPSFPFIEAKTEIDLVMISVVELGFPQHGASLNAIYTRARSLGLELCPPDLGLALRLSYLNQPRGEFLRIAMKPVARYNRELVDFTVGNDGVSLLVLGGEARPDLVLAGMVRFVFVRPRPDALSQKQARPGDADLAKR